MKSWLLLCAVLLVFVFVLDYFTGGPGVIARLVTVAIGAVIGYAVGWVIRRVLRAVRS